ELDRRRMSVPGDGPIDALATGLGWALGDPVTEARVAAYAAGGWDPDLCRFELRPEPPTDTSVTGRTECGRRARHLLGPRLALLEALDDRRWKTYTTKLSSELGLVERLNDDLDSLVEDVRRASGQLRDLADAHGNGDGLLTARQVLASSVEALAGTVDDLDAVSRRHQHPSPDPVEPGQRHRQAAALVGAVYACPGSGPPHRALRERVEAWRACGVRTAAQARRSIGDTLRSPSNPPAALRMSVDPRHLLGDVGSITAFPD
ncbi:MAG: hypothetical protein M3137_20700, partial [Actinomycetota bacterium]|nr:hypothetical protein [Actinomycetota bacterium]